MGRVKGFLKVHLRGVRRACVPSLFHYPPPMARYFITLSDMRVPIRWLDLVIAATAPRRHARP